MTARADSAMAEPATGEQRSVQPGDTAGHDGAGARSALRIVDADCHILEPPGIWDRWLPERYRDKAPKLVKDAHGGDAWLTAVGGDPDPIGLVATPGMPWDRFRWFGVTYEEARRGCYDGAARLEDMDADGVWAEVLYPPQRTMSHFLGDDDDDFVLAGVEAYNNFLFEEFCAPDPTRLVGLAQIPSLGIDTSVDLLRKAKARGAKGVLISNWPSGDESLSTDDDPFWAAAVDEGLPVAVHINIISRAQRAAGRRAAAKRGNALYDMTSEAARAKAIGGMSHVFSMCAGSVTAMLFQGVFERFPELQMCWIETGVGWLPHFVESLDDRYWRNRVWGDLPISNPPSFYWHRNNAATFITDRSGIALRHLVGIENMMWSSDYPHHGNDWPYSRKVIADTMGHIPASERELIVGGNARRIWHLDP